MNKESQSHLTMDHDEQPVLLVVDDDPDILRVVRFYLTKQRYKVLTATNGVEALSMLKEHPEIELVLSDVMMPEMNGLELLGKLRRDPQYLDLPVILISAEGETSKKVVGLNLGADDFITKPFNFDELMARVQNHIRLRNLQREVLMANRQVMHANEQLQEQNTRFQRDLDAARGVQMALLPDKLPEDERYRLGSRYLPAERLGGDFFDVVTLSDGAQIGVIVADVCGHGVAAALITAMTKLSFQNSSWDARDPGLVLGQMNKELFATLKDDFVTVFFGIYDTTTRLFHYASGGHPPLLLHRRSTGEVLELNPQSTFLGAFDPVEFEVDSVVLEPNDRVIFYTDGIYESHDPGGNQFGLDKMIRIIQKHAKMEIQSLMDLMVDEVLAHADGRDLDDDITIVGMDVS